MATCHQTTLHLLTIILIAKPITAVFATCTQASCTGQHLHCNDTQPDCTLQCTDYQACNTYYGLASYTCTGTQNVCEVECLGDVFCSHLRIYSSSNTRVACTGDSACLNAEIYVTGDTDDVNATITCNGNTACESALFQFNGNASGNHATVQCDRGCLNQRTECHFDNNQCDVKCAHTTNYGPCNYAELCCDHGVGDTCNIYFSNVKWSNTAEDRYCSFDGSCTNAPSNAPSAAPSSAPTQPPSRSPSSSPSQAPSLAPSFPPSVSPSNAPSNVPSVSPSNTPSAFPSASPTHAPSNSPTSRPTSYAFQRNRTTNFVMHHAFGINGFSFPAAIAKCMDYSVDGDQYIKFECIDNETAQSALYVDSDCSTDQMVADSQVKYETSDDVFKCNAEMNTYIELSVFSSKECVPIEKRTIYVTDSVCAALGNGDQHAIFYCNTYEDQGDVYADLWLQHFDDSCSIYGQIGKHSLGLHSDCDTLFGTGYYAKLSGCDLTRQTVVMTSTEYSTSDEGDDDVQDLSGYNVSGYVTVGVIFSLALIFVIIAFVFHRKREGTDRPGYVALLKLFSSIADLYTDVIFTLTLFALKGVWHYYIFGLDLWIWSAIFTLGPHFLSIVVGLFFITKWRQTRSKRFLSEYASRFDKVIVLLSLVAGFYAAIDMLSSHLFHLDVMSFQIGVDTKARLMNMKIINNVVLENVPCLYIQYLYLTSSDSDLVSNGMSITLLAMTFSILGILFGVLTVSVRICNGCIEVTRGDKSGTVYMVFTVKSEKEDVVQKYHVHSNFLLSEAISQALRVELTQVEVIYIQHIMHGVLVQAKVKYLEDQNRDNILESLHDVDSRMYSDFCHQIAEKIKIDSKSVTVNFSKLSKNKEDVSDSQLPLTKSIEINKVKSDKSADSPSAEYEE
eukprot:801093_1